MDDALQSGILLSVAVGVVGVFQSAMPKPDYLANGTPTDPAILKGVRSAEAHSLVGAAIIGTVGSVILRSSVPLILAGTLSVVMVGVNEWTLRR